LKAGDARVHHFGQSAVDEGEVAFCFRIAGEPDLGTGIEFGESASGGESVGGISGDGFRLSLIKLAQALATIAASR
jgi:hypothetical protein